MPLIDELPPGRYMLCDRCEHPTNENKIRARMVRREWNQPVWEWLCDDCDVYVAQPVTKTEHSDSIQK